MWYLDGSKLEDFVKNNSLVLIDKKIDDSDIKDICEFLKQNPNIHTLDVSRNKITAIGTKELSGITTLTTLNLSRNDLGDKGAGALLNNKTLTALDVSQNMILEDGAVALSKLEKLKTLDVGGNYIGSRGLQKLLGHKSLITLIAHSNDIDFKQFNVKLLKKNKTLTTLDIRNNKISDELIKKINSQIEQNKEVAMIDQIMPLGFFQEKTGPDEKGAKKNTFNAGFKFK